MREIKQSSQFKADLKKVAKSGKYEKIDLLAIIELLAEDHPLPEKHRDHELIGKWKHNRECHIKPDWLLIYRIEGNVLWLTRTGSHADLFKQ